MNEKWLARGRVVSVTKSTPPRGAAEVIVTGDEFEAVKAELDTLRTENGQLEAQCAAMRDALGAARSVIDMLMGDSDLIGAEDDSPEFSTMAQIASALTLDAGKALVERVQALERVAEAAEAWAKAHYAVNDGETLGLNPVDTQRRVEGIDACMKAEDALLAAVAALKEAKP